MSFKSQGKKAVVLLGTEMTEQSRLSVILSVTLSTA